HGEETDEEGDAAAVDDARENVAPELIGAEEELLARPRALFDQALLGGVGGREPRRSRRRHRQEGDHHEADEGEAIAPESLPGVGGKGGGSFSRHGVTPPLKFRIPRPRGGRGQGEGKSWLPPPG